MLNLLSTDSKGIGRREFLRIGSLAAGGVTLADLCRRRAMADNVPRDSAVIQIFLCGGPSQHDTFDPKPLAPMECRPFDSIETAMPGVRVTEFFPQLAAIFDEFSVVRSVHHGDGSHNHSVHWMQTGRYPDKLVFGQNQFPASGTVISSIAEPTPVACRRTSRFPMASTTALLPTWDRDTIRWKSPIRTNLSSMCRI